MGYCSSCGKLVAAGRKFCDACGTSRSSEIVQYRISGKERIVLSSNLVLPGLTVKSPVMAALLSFLWGGLGNLYLGQIPCGLTLMVVDLVLALTTFGIAHLFAMIALPIFAYREAAKLRRGLPIHKWGAALELV